MNRHLLVTNDFPPKVGGIQSYLWELWQRFDPDAAVVLTARSHPDHERFDAEQRRRGLRIERVSSRTLYFPSPRAFRRIRRLAEEADVGCVVFDPAVPLGLMAPRLGLPFAIVIHGAEVAVPARIPVAKGAVRYVAEHASLIISAGEYPAAELKRCVPRLSARIVVAPPGVNPQRITPLSRDARRRARQHLGLPLDALVISSVSRLVPRKGMDVLVDAAGLLAARHPQLVVAIAGAGRDAPRLRRRIGRSGAPVRMLGAVSEPDKLALLGSSDLFVMACRKRWGGLEQEGFGIVFLEAAAAGIAQIAGDSGGAAEAVVDGETGLVVRQPQRPEALAAAIETLIAEPELREKMGAAARRRAAELFDYERLATRVATALAEVGGS